MKQGMNIQRYPLAWPTGWPRKKSRAAAKFRASESVRSGESYCTRSKPLDLSSALGRLEGEMRRLGVREGDWLISSDLKIRLDGMPYSNQAQPADPGVAVYFRLGRADRVLACDAWTRIADNVAAIAAHIECLRGIDRYGVGTMDQAFAGYQALPAKGTTWRTTLGFAPGQAVTLADVDQAFRARARTAHPDIAGGSHDAMASLTAARAEAVAEIG